MCESVYLIDTEEIITFLKSIIGMKLQLKLIYPVTSATTRAPACCHVGIDPASRALRIPVFMGMTGKVMRMIRVYFQNSIRISIQLPKSMRLNKFSYFLKRSAGDSRWLTERRSGGACLITAT